MRVALIHYWLINWRGGERVLKAIADLYPDADIYTHLADSDLVKRELPGHHVSTTFISRLPASRRYYQRYLPLMPLALEQLDLRAYDLVISSESGPAKGVIINPHALHICYCHSPMRYVWDMYHEYRMSSSRATRVLMAPLLHYIRMWDQISSQRVDHYIANSRFVAKRIEKYYRRSADVVYPPVAINDFDASQSADPFYLFVGQLVRYKRPDLLVEAFNQLGSPLIVIGDGEMLSDLRRAARPNVQLLGPQPFNVIRDHYARCRAFVFPGIEDFGIVLVEAMASGKPVIALGYGGASETVVDGLTGLHFKDQSVAGIVGAVHRFEQNEHTFNRQAIRQHASQFSEQLFKERLRTRITEATSQASIPNEQRHPGCRFPPE